MEASIIIPTRNRKVILFETLAYITQEKGNFECIVIDQSDEGILEEEISRIDSRIRLVYEEKRGAPHARNVGVSHAKGDILVFFDDDVVPQTPNLIASHIKNYADEKIGMVAGRVKQPYEHKTVQKPGRILPYVYMVFGGFNAEARQPVNNVIGCNFSMRKSLWNDLGGMDEYFVRGVNHEESELAIRVAKSGYEIIFDPVPFVHHLEAGVGGNRDNAASKREYRYWIFHHWLYVFRKHGSLLWFPLFLMLAFLRTLYYVFADRDIMLFYITPKALLEQWRGKHDL